MWLSSVIPSCFVNRTNIFWQAYYSLNIFLYSLCVAFGSRSVNTITPILSVFLLFPFSCSIASSAVLFWSVYFINQWFSYFLQSHQSQHVLFWHFCHWILYWTCDNTACILGFLVLLFSLSFLVPLLFILMFLFLQFLLISFLKLLILYSYSVLILIFFVNLSSVVSAMVDMAWKWSTNLVSFYFLICLFFLLYCLLHMINCFSVFFVAVSFICWC